MKHTTRVAPVAVALLLGACGGDTDGGEAHARSSQPVTAAQPILGSVDFPDTSFAFRLTRCDLTGSSPDGILLRGSGTMPDGSLLLPDGRTMSIEVERLIPEMGGAGFLYERATVQFGSFLDEDAWEATAMSRDGSSWSTGDMMESLDGPIIEISGNDLTVAATYKHESRDEQVEGTLEVTCPAPTYP